MGRPGRKLDVCTNCARKGLGKWRCVYAGSGKYDEFRRECRYCGGVWARADVDDVRGTPTLVFVPKRAEATCCCAGPNYHPDKPCPVHPKNGPHAAATR